MSNQSATAAGFIGTFGLHALFFLVLMGGSAVKGATALHRSAAGPDYVTLLAIPSIDAADSRGVQLIVPPMTAPRIAAARLDPGILPLLHIEQTTDEPSAVAKVASQTAFINECHDRYADASSYARSLSAVSLHQGAVEISGGDHDRALMALRCLQALGALGAIAVTQSPGS